jgi:hypothetical protein
MPNLISEWTTLESQKSFEVLHPADREAPFRWNLRLKGIRFQSYLKFRQNSVPVFFADTQNQPWAPLNQGSPAIFMLCFPVNNLPGREARGY